MSPTLPVTTSKPVKYGACDFGEANLKSAELSVSTGGPKCASNGAAQASNRSVNENTTTTDEEAALDASDSSRTFVVRMADRVPCLGILMALCASFFLGSAGMLVKMTRSVHGIQVAVLR